MINNSDSEEENDVEVLDQESKPEENEDDAELLI